MANRVELDARLEALEAEVSELRKDMNAFFGAFEERSEQIWLAADPKNQAYVLEALEAIIERAGING